MRRIAPAIAIALASLHACDALAQQRPGRDRGDFSRESMSRDRNARPGPAAASSSDPYAALERELPSLKVDLLLTAEQLDSWIVFERDVRQVAEIDRTRTRQLIALRDTTREPPGAVGLLGSLADMDRRKSDATTDLKLHLEALYARLDEKQKKMLDRRVALSQTEPLALGR